MDSHAWPCMAMHGPPVCHPWVKLESKKAFPWTAHPWAIDGPSMGRKTDMSEKFELRWKLG